MLPLTKNNISHGLGSLLVSVLMITILLGIFSPGVAQAQQNCDEELAEAEQKYNSGRFDEAIELIGKCLEKPNITEEEKKRAYRLLGLNYIAKDYLQEAKTAVRRLLDLIPNYKPDTVQDPPTFTNLVEEVRDEMQAEQAPKQVQKKPVMKERSRRVSQASPLRFGLRGGLQMANISEDLSGTETIDLGDGILIEVNSDQGTRNTFGVGGFIEYWISSTFALQFNALYSMKGVKLNGDFDQDIVFQGTPMNVSGEFEDLIEVSYLSFPILGKLAFGKGGSVQPFIILGPEIGILLSAKDVASGEVTASAQGMSASESFEEEIDIKDDTESTEFALNFGGGFTIPLGSMQLFVDGRYGLGLSNVVKDSDESVKNNVIYIHAGLVFGGN